MNKLYVYAKALAGAAVSIGGLVVLAVADKNISFDEAYAIWAVIIGALTGGTVAVTRNRKPAA